MVTFQSKGRTITGRVLTVDDHGTTFEVGDKSQTIAWADLGRGKVQVEFNRSEKE
jgi:hypothetical protein